MNLELTHIPACVRGAPPLVGLAGVRDKSEGLSRAEIRCGFHAIQAEAKRRQEATARRKRHEALRREARENEARKAEAARYVCTRKHV